MTLNVRASYRFFSSERRGRPARCVLLFSPDDVAIQEYFLSGTYPTKRQVRQVYETIEHFSAATGKLAGSDVVSLDGARRLAGLGYRFFTYGGDLAYLTAGVAAAGSELRRALKSKA